MGWLQRPEAAPVTVMDGIVVGDEAMAAPPLSPPSPPPPSAAPITAIDGAGSEPTAPTYVYALGEIEPRFPSVAVEKELAQAIGRTAAAEQTDRQALHSVLAQRPNRYLARQLCWVFSVEGLETYIVLPKDPTDLDLFVDAVRPRPTPGDLDVVIGELGPVAEPERCNGLVLPMVAVDQLYSFQRDELIAAIPAPKGTKEAQFRATAEELLDRVLQLADNAGATDEHRAVNYLSVRYPAVYAQTAQAHAENRSLASVSVVPSRLTGPRSVVDVIFSYTDRQTDATDKYFVRVDVTEEFPFLVSKMAPYLDR